jgi:hypothetical protein
MFIVHPGSRIQDPGFFSIAGPGVKKAPGIRIRATENTYNFSVLFQTPEAGDNAE